MQQPKKKKKKRMQSSQGLENEKGKRDASEALVSPNKIIQSTSQYFVPGRILMYITYQNNYIRATPERLTSNGTVLTSSFNQMDQDCLMLK